VKWLLIFSDESVYKGELWGSWSFRQEKNVNNYLKGWLEEEEEKQGRLIGGEGCL